MFPHPFLMKLSLCFLSITDYAIAQLLHFEAVADIIPAVVTGKKQHVDKHLNCGNEADEGIRHKQRIG
jgi:hypothetical protein